MALRELQERHAPIMASASAIEPVGHNNLGLSMYDIGDWGMAEEHFKYALRAWPLPPPTDHAYINLATLHKAENRVKPTINAAQGR